MSDVEIFEQLSMPGLLWKFFSRFQCPEFCGDFSAHFNAGHFGISSALYPLPRCGIAKTTYELPPFVPNIICFQQISCKKTFPITK